MGQYYLIVDVDKRQFLHPHHFSDGLKLLEFGSSGQGTMLGLAVLLADGNNRGSGDLRSKDPVIGSWAGDRIVVAGDYADPWKHVPDDLENQLEEHCLREQQERGDLTGAEIKQYAERNCTLYECAKHFFMDISDQVLMALCADAYIRQALVKRLAMRLDGPWQKSYPVPDCLARMLGEDRS